MKAEPAPAQPGPAQKKAAKANLPSPPSTILAAPNSLPMTAAASFDLIPTIQGRDGTRALCTAKVSLAAGDTPLDALLKSRDAVNGNAACQQEPVTAIVSGVPPEAIRGEDLLYSPPTLKVRAPNAVGGQLFTAIRAPAGDATKTCFDVSGIGVPVQNQVAVMKIELDTPSGGAAGGELTVLERSPLGVCSVSVKTAPGESAAQIATAVMNAFQAPGVPGAPRCPSAQNPRDVTVEGSQIISVLATELRVCTTDPGLGIFIGPKELGDSRRLSLQYAVKLLCGPSEKTSSGKPDPRVAPGRYFTTVNLHNPSGRRVTARFKVAVALPGKAGPISRFVSFVVGPDDAISIDCSQLLDRLGVTPGFNDGFIVVESEGELDVVAVYTAAGATGKVETLGTERVPGRLR